MPYQIPPALRALLSAFDDVGGGSSSTAAGPSLPAAVFHQDYPAPRAGTPPSFAADVGRDALGVARGARQAFPGAVVGLGDFVAGLPGYAADVAVNAPLSALATLQAVATPLGQEPTLDVPAARQMHQNRQAIQQAMEPVTRPVHDVLTAGANTLYGAPQTRQEALGRQIGEITGQLAGGAVPLPGAAEVAGKAFDALQGLGERGAVGSTGRALLPAVPFPRTNKGFHPTTEVGRRLLIHDPDEAIGLAKEDLQPSEHAVELPGGAKGKVMVRPGDNLFTTKVTPEHKQAMTGRLFHGILKDVRAALADPEVAEGASWYRGSITQMENELQKVYPELADPNKMAYAKLLIAMTSPNNAPEPNIRQAMDIYSRYRLGLHGGGPSATAAGVSGTKSSGAIDDQIQSLEMVRQIFTDEAGGDADKGLANMVEWLQQPGAGRGGRQAAPVVRDLLGRKTTNFWMNMMGHDDNVTADVWAIRNARRHWGYQVLEGKRVADGKGGFRTDGLTLEGAPTDPEYDAIEEAYRQAAQHISQETGQAFSPMDVQALTWYREKKLWGQAGAEPSDLDDFASAARKYAANPTQVLDPAHGDLALRGIDTYYGRKIRPKQIDAMDDEEALRRINAERNAGVRAEVGADQVTDPQVARSLLLRSERGAVGNSNYQPGDVIRTPDEFNRSRETRVAWQKSKSAELTAAGVPHHIKRGAIGPASHIVIDGPSEQGVSAVGKPKRYTLERWESPDGEKGWLVLDHEERENGGPAPVDIFPTKKMASEWIRGKQQSGKRGVSGAAMLSGLSAGPAGGSVAGGVIGGRVGDTPEERRRNALAGAAGGAALGAVLSPALVRGAQEILSRSGSPEKSLGSLVEELRARPDGFTYDPRTRQFVERGGVMVANPPGARGAVIDDLNDESLQRVLDDNRELFGRPGIMLGGWRDQAGKFYLEPAEAAPDVETALKLARERNERAVFDLDNMQEVQNPHFLQGEAGRVGTVPRIASDFLQKTLSSAAASARHLLK